MGLGSVGGGVAAALLDRSETLSNKIGLPIGLKKILVRDPGKTRDPAIPSGLLTTNPEDILDDDDIHVVVEVIGGTDPAASYLKRALSAGKHVVTANKEVMAQSGPELFRLAEQNRVNLLFEASVAGGIPIVGCLMNELLANDVFSIRGIINGTTNYILTRMAHQGAEFQQALKEAQDKGYAESDPTNDVEGIDAVYKLSILASLAFHHRVAPQDIYRQGISTLEANDFRYANELGYAIKSLAIASLENGSIQARVYPALIPLDHMLAKVDGVYNAVEVEGSLCGKVLFHGMGAGREPTTSAVVGDLIEIARRIGVQGPPSPMVQNGRPLSIRSIDELETRYYLRLTVADRPGVLAQISKILGDGGISLASVIQKDSDPAQQTAELVITTHPAREASMQRSLQQVAGLEVVTRISNLLRIEGQLDPS
ncbi:MAG: homoserine dehydrogenase [Chloroflexi bacterium]|nr:homoserine dehydrogenase [Chloroflexota bacterium]